MNTPDKLTRSEQARINGAKSNGPSTPAGKQRAKYNAFKHGFAAAATSVLVIEDKAAWELHLQGCRDSFEPQNYVEQSLVDQLASISWRQSRLIRTETTLIELQISLQNDAIEELHPEQDGDPAFHVALAWQTLAARPPQNAEPSADPVPPHGNDITSIELVRRYLVTLDRQYRNVLLNLRQYRKDFAPRAKTTVAAVPQQAEEPAKPNEPKTQSENPPLDTVRKPPTPENRPLLVPKSMVEPVIGGKTPGTKPDFKR